MVEHLQYIHKYEAAKDTRQEITLLLLHGTGGDEDALSELGRMLLPGAAQLRPRGNVSEFGMPRFFRRFAEGVLDVEDLKQRGGELATFVEQASVMYGFDARQVVVAGFSNGANIAAGMLFLYPKTFRAAVLLHPMVPFEPETLPNLNGKPIFIGAGRSDPLVPTVQTEHLQKLLEEARANVSVFLHNGGHSVSLEEVKAVKNWLAENKLSQ